MGNERLLFRVKGMNVFSNRINKFDAGQSLKNSRDSINVAFLFSHHLGILAVVLEHFVIVCNTALSLILEEHTIYVALVKQVFRCSLVISIRLCIYSFLLSLRLSSNLNFIVPKLNRVDEDCTALIDLSTSAEISMDSKVDCARER